MWRAFIGHTGSAVEAGLAYVTEDRKHLGLVLMNNIMHNTTLANLDASLRDDMRFFIREAAGVAGAPPRLLRGEAL